MKLWSVLSIFALATGAAAFDFAAYRAEVLRDPALIRYYTFEEGKGDEATNLVPIDPGKLAMSGGPLGSMTILNDSPYGTDRTNYHFRPGAGAAAFEWGAGRFPGKSSLTNGLTRRGLFRNGVSGAEFAAGATFAGWIRIHELAARNGEAAVLSLGNAYDCGFQLGLLKAPYARENQLSFRLGSADKKPVTVVAKPVPAGVWHHFAATLDGKNLVFYLDGKEVSRAETTGSIVPPANKEYGSNAFFEYSDRAAYMRVGGSPSGPRGTMRFDLDELAVYKRPLSTDEIVRLERNGRPENTPEQQLAEYKEQEKARATRESIRMEIPNKTMGFFERGKAIPVTFLAPADLGVLVAEYELRDLNGTRITGEKKDFSGTCDFQVLPKICDVLILDLKVRKADGTLLKKMQEPYTLGIVPPSPAKLGKSNPLGYLALVDSWNYNFPIRRLFYYYQHKDEEKYNNSFLETLKEDADKIPGYRPMVCIQIPWLAKITDADRKSLAEGFARIATFLKGKVASWEVSNEPNGKISPENYFEIMKIAVKAMRDADPAIPICAPGASPSGLPFINDLLKMGMGDFIDAVSFHNYVGAPISTYHWDNSGATLKKMIAAHSKKALPIWNSESGFFTLQRVGGKPMTQDLPVRMGIESSVYRGVQYFHTSMPALPETPAAARQVQAILLDLASGYEMYIKCQSAALAAVDGTSTSALPTRMGVALSTLGGQILNDFKSVNALPMASLDQMALMITENTNRRIAAVFSLDPVVLNFQAKPNAEYRLMDYLGNEQTLRADTDGLLTLNVAETPQYLFGVPEDFRELAPLSLNLPAKLPENQILEGTLTVKNPFARPLSGVLRPASIAGAEITVDPAQINVPPRGEIQCKVTLKASSLKRKPYDVAVALHGEDGAIRSKAQAMFESPGVTHMIPQIRRPFLLDGDAAKWKDIPAADCRDEESVVHGKPNLAELWLPQWRGNDDLSFRVRLAWRKNDALYFLLEVRDDVVFPAPSGQNGMAFRYDCLELFFDGRTAKEQGKPIADGADQVIVIPRAGETAAACDLWYARRHREQISVECVGKKTAEGYLIEGKIKPNDKSAFRLLAGSQFYLDFLVDDTDKPEEMRKSAMALHGTFNNSISSAQWGRYELSLDTIGDKK